MQTDLQHNHHAAVTDIAGGAMNGFSACRTRTASHTMLAYTTAFPGELPDYWGWAKRYELLDHTFSSGDTSSFPNHLYTVAADAAGSVDGPNFGVENWGCDGPAHLSVPVIRHGELVHVPPCFPIDSIGAQLDRRGIPWSEYGPPENGHGYGWVAYDAVKPIRESASYARHVLPLGWLPSDLDQGYLAAVTWIVPPYNAQRPPRRRLAVRGRELDGRPDQPDHAPAGLAPHGHRAHLGRVGRLLRPRRARRSRTGSGWASACPCS